MSTFWTRSGRFLIEVHRADGHTHFFDITDRQSTPTPCVALAAPEVPPVTSGALSPGQANVSSYPRSLAGTLQGAVRSPDAPPLSLIGMAPHLPVIPPVEVLWQALRGVDRRSFKNIRRGC